MPSTVRTDGRQYDGSRIRRWLQRRVLERVATPSYVATLDQADIAPGFPASAEVLDLDVTRPSASANLGLMAPEATTFEVQPHLPVSHVQHTDSFWEFPSVSPNLVETLTVGKVDGTLFFYPREEEHREHIRRRAPVVTPSERRVGDSKKVPFNLFELLLPVLLPPAKTEFGEELLLPQELYLFQNYGVKWLIDHDDALLADDMGLGKTVQAITAFRILLRQGKALQCLVVCPKSVVSSWRRHFEDWAPELQVVTIRGGKQARNFQWAAYARKAHAILVNYELLRSDADAARENIFDVIVADEIQKIKNSTTATSQAMRKLKAPRRWGLTGTPLENRPEDVVAIFGFIQPGLFRHDELFYASPHTVRSKIAPYMLRRRKEDVLKDLPSKVKDIRYVELEEIQRRAYDEAERTGRIQLETGEKVTVQHVFALITRLKQICNFDPETGESAKLEWLKDHLETAVEEESKVLVFSQFVEALTRIKPHVQSYYPLQYTGELSVSQRDRIVQQFQDDATNRVMLMSLRAGGMGITLTAANYVVHFDSWWNPAVMAQAEDRTHRIGQRKTVFVTTLVAEDTVEERIQRLLEQKRYLFTRVIDDLSDFGLQKVLSEEELFGLFGLKPRRLPPEQPVKHVPQSATQAAYVFKPQEPFSNIVKLREILRSCEEYIWWEDPHFGVRALEELAMVVDPSRIREIRILSRQDQFNEKAKRELERFSAEMGQKGISVEWRITERSISHDRYIISAKSAYNVPPVNAIFQGTYGEGLRTANRPPFEQWWETAYPVIR
ncbi:MAG: DEAD/DEAH box helicase [Anaerolineae bacterium]